MRNELHPALLRQRIVAGAQRPLHVGRAAQRIDHRLEHGEHRVARVVHDAAAVALDALGDQIEIFREPPVGGVLVLAGEAGVAGDVGVEDGGELSR